MIPFWSDTNSKVKEILFPTKETIWSDLSIEDKKKMWKYLEYHLFNLNPESGEASFDRVSCRYQFYGKDIWENDHLVKTIANSMLFFNEKYKKATYAEEFLKESSFDSACRDFYRIFMQENRDVVFEMLTLYSRVMVLNDSEKLWQGNDENDEDFQKRKDKEQWKRFDSFSARLSEVFEEFGVNYKLTRDGFIKSDEPVVIEKIYEPALKKLSSKKWGDVNRDIRDSFSALNDDKDGSGSITHTLAALQGFLQILVNGKTGKGDTSNLIVEALKKQLIPDDDFSKKIIKEMNSFWAKERQDKGDPHPKKSYATKSQAKLVISLVMVFIDHVL